ncbi:hypothetical protein H6G64_00105 [Calothrix sp. FACHB-156]|nr:hypothetical protein [Calothrix sp. FACHB-156]
MTALNLSKVKFTNQSNVVNPDRAIFNPQYSYVDTLRGNDKIIGSSHLTADFAFGAFIDIESKRPNRSASIDLRGKASVATYGIKNEGIINTNNGDDIIRGTATANISATAVAVSQVIAIAQKRNASAIAKTFASLNIKATADGIDNSGGAIFTGSGNDSVTGNTEGAVSAVAIAIADASAIVEAICKAPMSEGLTAFAGAIAESLAKATITATGINNHQGIINTGIDKDTISASATSSAGTFTSTDSSTFATATPENQALARAVARASALAFDKAIAIDNTQGYIRTGTQGDTIEATASASDLAIAINNNKGYIHTGMGNDTINAQATGSESYGIFGGTIDTGNGADEIIASSFGGGVNIDMGDGEDFVQGFGNARVDGGKGCDTFDLGAYNREDFQISFGVNSVNNIVIFQLDKITMITTGFEQFNFANNSVSLAYNELLPT